MAQVTATTGMTLAEFLRSPLAEEEPSWEYYPGGKLSRKVSPTTDHGIVQAELAHIFLGFVDEQGITLQVVTEVRAALPRWSPVPDFTVYGGRFVAGVRYPSDAPVLVAEILSPDQTRAEMIEKVRAFLVDGAAVGLVVDPERREVLLVHPDTVRTYRDDEPVPLAAPELAGLNLTPRRIFARLP